MVINDGQEEQSFHLNRSYMGLLVPKGLWRVMNNFSTNSLALILSDMDYDENDYIRDFDEYRRWNQTRK